MRFCGWKTRRMFHCYNVIDEADLAAAVIKRFNSYGRVHQRKRLPAHLPRS